MKDQGQESSDNYVKKSVGSSIDEISNVTTCQFVDCSFYNEKGNDCHSCEYFIGCSQSYLSYYIKIPFFLIDNFMSKQKLSHSAFIVFLYICRRADFNPRSNHFGRCWLTLKTISEATGIKVSNMRKYLNELQKIGMISWGFMRRKDEEGYKTTHEFNVTHIKPLVGIKEAGKELRVKWDRARAKVIGT